MSGKETGTDGLRFAYASISSHSVPWLLVNSCAAAKSKECKHRQVPTTSGGICQRTIKRQESKHVKAIAVLLPSCHCSLPAAGPACDGGCGRRSPRQSCRRQLACETSKKS